MIDIDSDEDDSGAGRDFYADWRRRHGLQAVGVERAQLESINMRAEAENLMPEQHQDARRESSEEAMGQLLNDMPKPAA